MCTSVVIAHLDFENHSFAIPRKEAHNKMIEKYNFAKAGVAMDYNSWDFAFLAHKNYNAENDPEEPGEDGMIESERKIQDFVNKSKAMYESFEKKA